MRRFVVLCALLLTALPALAGGISVADQGVYSVIGKGGKPAGTYFRLYRRNGLWVMDARREGKRWVNISCDPACRYHASSASDIKKFVPGDMRARDDIACIQNTAQAFCRINPKGAPQRTHYLIVALITPNGEPLPVPLRRLGGQ